MEDPTLYNNTYQPVYDTTYSSSTTDPTTVWIWLILVALTLVALWRVFTKAGRPGWAAIVPFYSIWVMNEIAGRPGWWMFLYFIPLVNIVIHIIVCIDLAKAFGKSTLFGIFGLYLFGFVGFPMLAWGSAKYTKPTPKT